MGYNRPEKMKQNIKFYLLSCTALLLLCSCGASGKQANSELNHQWRLGEIKLRYNNCLRSAHSAADSAECESNRDKEVEEENEKYENEKEIIKEINSCQEVQTTILECWGYSKKEAKKTARELASKRSINNFSFDCGEAIAELRSNGFKDHSGTQIFTENLPKFGISADSANSAITKYYEDDLFYDDGLSNSKDAATQCLMQIRIGKDIKITKKLLIELDLLEDDSSDDDDSDDSNDSNVSPANPPRPDIPHDTPTSPSPIKPSPTNTYQTDAAKISELSVSKYGFNEDKLTQNQMRELDAVIEFMEKWPNAVVTIIGHTCNIGSEDNNKIVGMRRAQQAKSYIVGHGIKENRIIELSKAASEPCADNNTEEGRQLNRRITFIVK